jgi:monofunctional biosynthetic peptidoglycan transglycosylase
MRRLAALILLPYALTIFYTVLPAPSTLMLADIATLNWPKRQWVSLDKISPNLVQAVLVAEDSAFCEHFGFDWKQIEKNLDKAMDGKRFGGASTITQQTAKNLFLWNGRSWLRKFLETPLTLWMELVLSKRRILTLYLNTAEWGEHVYGAQAASQKHFGINARELSRYQSALLAATLPNPIERSAGYPGSYVVAAAGLIAARAHTVDTGCLK